MTEQHTRKHNKLSYSILPSYILRASLTGRMPYAELCEVLLKSCADWTAEEQAIVGKILAPMGVLYANP